MLIKTMAIGTENVFFYTLTVCHHVISFYSLDTAKSIAFMISEIKTSTSSNSLSLFKSKYNCVMKK